MTGLSGPVSLHFSIASGMMVNQHSDIHNTLRILQQTDSVRTIVLTDLFMTPSARNADLLLPAPSFLKRTYLSALAVRIICCTIMRRFPRFSKQVGAGLDDKCLPPARYRRGIL